MRRLTTATSVLVMILCALPGLSADKKKPKKKARRKARVTKVRPENSTPHWVWLSVDDKPAGKVYLRKIVDSGGVSAARLYAASDDRMTVYVDGKKVLENSDKPAFADISQELDLDAPQKKHVIAVEAENESGPAGVLLRIDLESGWRAAWSIVTDESWQASNTPDEGWLDVGFEAKGWGKPQLIAKLGEAPWEKITAQTLEDVAPLKKPQATPVESLKVVKNFNVELLYSVPKDEQGSWVNLCVDPKGRLITSDQYGILYRVTPPTAGTDDEILVEPINVDIGEAQGLLWAFDSLYVSVNRGDTYPGGLYRVRDTTGDDQLDSVETLRPLDGSGEHGPHAVLPHPDGESLVVVCGNRTRLTEIDSSRVPQNWDEDLLLPRPQGRFMVGVRAPGGYICRIDPDGKEWELLASGFRNEYDAAFSLNGELFAYDADMEWDINTPWYRPTRICHVVSGAEFGWRSGGGKWPVHYPDSLPPVVDVGPGSPTGVAFGYGAKFPAKYQKALFACDWSYGKLYAVHLTEHGASYRGALEEFVTGVPLPLTDLIINPHDGAMYFLIGGRRVQSGLYRVTYTGAESTAPIDKPALGPLYQQRRAIEKHHADPDENTVNEVWEHLGSPHRFIRYAARVAVEHRPASEWRDRALTEKDPLRLLTALLALARMYERTDKGVEPDIDTPVPDWDALDLSSVDEGKIEARNQILEALGRLAWEKLDVQQRICYLRVLTVTFVRIAPPSAQQRAELTEFAKESFPAKSSEVNAELAQLMVYVQAPIAAELLVPRMEQAPTQEEQIGYAKTLRHLKAGWTTPLREQYFRWFTRAAGYRGGASFVTFVNRIKEDAVALLDEEEKTKLASILNEVPKETTIAFSAKNRPVVKKWTMQELVPLIQKGLENRDFDHGRKMFAAASCFACHRFDNQGGAVGPDLTQLSGRFSPRDILESIVEPSKQVSDQYAAVQILTIDGEVVTGRIVNLAGDSIRVQTNMLDPAALVGVDRKLIEAMKPSELSMMPTGLLDTLDKEEILDLMAYLLSRGDRNHPMFAQKQARLE